MSYFSLFLAAALLLTTAPAGAVDLRNEGEQTVEIEVRSSTMKKLVTVPPRTLSIVICVGACVFEARGMGRVEASGSDVVAIRAGTLEHRPAPAIARR